MVKVLKLVNFISEIYYSIAMKIKSILHVLLVIAVLMAVFHFLDFLALHDIHNDYASEMVTTRFASPENFPEWTHTPGEWALIDFSFAARFISLVCFIVLLVWALRKVKTAN